MSALPLTTFRDVVTDLAATTGHATNFIAHEKDRGVYALRVDPITDRDELERELRSVCNQRVAFDREEYVEGHQCVVSPVVGDDSEPVGAVSVMGANYHMSGKPLEEEVTGLVMSAAKSIETELLSLDLCTIGKHRRTRTAITTSFSMVLGMVS